MHKACHRPDQPDILIIKICGGLLLFTKYLGEKACNIPEVVSIGKFGGEISVDPIFLELQLQGPAADAQDLRSVGAVAAGIF